MTDDKVREVLDRYERELLRVNEHGHWTPHERTQLGHMFTMIPQMRQMLDDGKREKVMRWLGFMQGFFWTQGIFTLDELKAHNREEQFIHVAFAGPQTKRPYDFTFPLEDAKVISRELAQAIKEAEEN